MLGKMAVLVSTTIPTRGRLKDEKWMSLILIPSWFQRPSQIGVGWKSSAKNRNATNRLVSTTIPTRGGLKDFIWRRSLGDKTPVSTTIPARSGLMDWFNPLLKLIRVDWNEGQLPSMTVFRSDTFKKLRRHECVTDNSATIICHRRQQFVTDDSNLSLYNN